MTNFPPTALLGLDPGIQERVNLSWKVKELDSRLRGNDKKRMRGNNNKQKSEREAHEKTHHISYLFGNDSLGAAAMVSIAALVAGGGEVIMTQTLLKIQGAGMPPVLLEECTQVLEAVPLGGLHRTVNGELIYTGAPGLMKYKTVCSGVGKVAPGLAALKRGDKVTLQCIQRLWQEVGGSSILLSRPAVPETVLVMDEKRQAVEHILMSPTEITVKQMPGGSLYLSYCPILIMRVVDLALNTVEWGETASWTIGLEEV